MTLQGDLALRHERGSHTTANLSTSLLATAEGLRLRQTQPEDNNQHRWASSEPEEGTPAMGRGINQRARKSRRKQIPERIPLLQQAGDNTTRCDGTVLQRGSRRVTVQSAHGDTEQSPGRKELPVGLGETGAELENDEEHLVGDEGPLTAPSVRCDTEDDGSDGTKHQHGRDAPGDIGDGCIEGFGQVGGG